MRRLGLLILLVAALLSAQPVRGAARMAARPPAYLLDEGDAAGRAWLTQAGARQLASYAAFSLWELPAGQPSQAVLLSPGIIRAGTQIPLRGLTIDTALPQPEPPLPAALTAAAIGPSAPRLWLIQFAGPLQPAWLDALRARGQTVAACLPEYACVLWGRDPGAALAPFGMLARWSGPFHPAYRLHPALRPGGELRQPASPAEVEITLQFLAVDAAAADLAALRASAALSAPPSRVLNFWNVRARLSPASIDRLASLPTLFNIEPYNPPVLHEEMQAQILAGQLSSAPGLLQAVGPGYLDWLALRGFSTDPALYPLVDVVDDGIDNGTTLPLHPDFYAYPPALPPSSRVKFQRSCLSGGTTNGVQGHGNLNAGIMAGYNAGSVSTHQDAAGFAFGLGVSPYGAFGGTKIFSASGFDISACGSTFTHMVSGSYAAGARITSNSWGSSAGAFYDTFAQQYDALTRDASPSTPGDQQMLHIFSAGNDGRAQSIGTPGVAKNVLTVGATDLPRDIAMVDGCGRTSSASAANLASYSSRGPTADGRIKPDLVAPGTHVQGPASQDPAYASSSLEICGGPAPHTHYYPPTSPNQQTLYTISDGTSHAAPAVSGAAQLAWERYLAAFGQPAPPSPAMLKALLLNTPRYLDGAGTGGNLPGPGQGWGMPDLETAFDSSTRFLLDQSRVFSASGEVVTLTGTVVDPARPFHVSLVWTDAPGTPVGAASVNNLDLQVTTGGVTYLGNVFSGANSAQGGQPDPRNNVENVFLPAGAGADFTVRVVARSLAGDGVPSHPGATDQDFALVIYNGKALPTPELATQSASWQEDPISSNRNHAIDPGEKASLAIEVVNLSELIDATGVQAVLDLQPGQASLLSTQPQTAPLIPKNAIDPVTFRFGLQIHPDLACQTPVTALLRLTYSFIRTPPFTLAGEAELPIPPYPLCSGASYASFFPFLIR